MAVSYLHFFFLEIIHFWTNLKEIFTIRVVGVTGYWLGAGIPGRWATPPQCVGRWADPPHCTGTPLDPSGVV